MKPTFKQFLDEAKYAHHDKQAIYDQLSELVFNSFYDERNYIGDFDTADDYAMAAVNGLDDRLRELVPQAHLKDFIDSAWSSYHELNPEDFADTESYVDALINDILKGFHWWLKRVEL
jgi:hypothetical protein